MQVGASAALALGSIGADAVGPLTEALKDKHRMTRTGAALALGHIGPKAKPAIGALTAALKDPDERVRKAHRRSRGKRQ